MGVGVSYRRGGGNGEGARTRRCSLPPLMYVSKPALHAPKNDPLSE